MGTVVTIGGDGAVLRGQQLRRAARDDVRRGMYGNAEPCATHGIPHCPCAGTLASVLPGIGTEVPNPDDVIIVSRIVGYDVRQAAETVHFGWPNVAFLRARLRWWAVAEIHGLRPVGGAE